MTKSTTQDRSQQLAALKTKGEEFIDLLESLRTPPEQVGPDDETIEGLPQMAYTVDRELDIAVERAEEAIMWAEKHLAD